MTAEVNAKKNISRRESIKALMSSLTPIFLLALLTCWLSACSQADISAYQQDMQDLQQSIADIEARLSSGESDTTSKDMAAKEPALANIPPEAISQAPRPLLIALSELYHKKAVLTGKYQDYQQLEHFLDKMSGQLNHPPELRYAKAKFYAGMHKFGEATRLLDSLPPELSESTPVRALRLDIALQQGKYQQAQTQLQTLIADAPDWENKIRLAHYTLNTGKVSRARALYQEAAEMLSAKQMYQYAWVNLQQGLLELDLANYDQALKFYQIADRAYSGYWLIEEHIAEVLALTGKTNQAKEMYRVLVRKNPNPELKLALADLLAEQKNSSEEAEQLRNEAMAEFNLRQQLYPEAAVGHFVERLLSLEQTHPELLSSARLNFNARPNADSKALLAKSYLKLGQTEQAEQLYRQILTTPWRNPGIEELAQGLDKTLE